MPQAFPYQPDESPQKLFPPPPPCPLANIFCSPAHMVMTFSLKVCGTVTLRIHRRVTWMTTRWATHKSNQKRLVTENRANSHSCNALLFSSTCRLCVSWQSDLDRLSHGCLSCCDLWFMSNMSCTEKDLGYLRKVFLKERKDLTLLKREICIFECNAFYRIALMLEGISACQGIYSSFDLTQPFLVSPLQLSDSFEELLQTWYNYTVNWAQTLQYFALVLALCNKGHLDFHCTLVELLYTNVSQAIWPSVAKSDFIYIACFITFFVFNSWRPRTLSERSFLLDFRRWKWRSTEER